MHVGHVNLRPVWEMNEVDVASGEVAARMSTALGANAEAVCEIDPEEGAVFDDDVLRCLRILPIFGGGVRNAHCDGNVVKGGRTRFEV